MKKIKGFDIFANVFLIIIVCYCLVPLVLLVASSLTSNEALIREGYSFFPKEFSVDAYKYLVSSGSQIIRAYGMSFVVTGLGTVCSILLTTSRRQGADLPGILHHAVQRRLGAHLPDVCGYLSH